jgi:MFS family permease
MTTGRGGTVSTPETAAPGDQADGHRTGRRVALTALCTTQITSWDVLYYAFPVLAGDITVAIGWSTPTITAALSVSQLVGILVGRWLDQHGPREVMTAGSLLGVPAVVAVATAQNLGDSSLVGCWLGRR